MLTHADLYSLEQYARVRSDFRTSVIAHKKNRRVALGENAALYFEDALTMQYQVQEMLRLERMFEPDLIQEELDVYNPLIPDGSNWKATFMVEVVDAEERKGHSFMTVPLKVLVDYSQRQGNLFAESPIRCSCFGGTDDATGENNDR